MSRLPAISNDQAARENDRRNFLDRQRAALLSGQPSSAPTSPVPARHINTAPRLLTQTDMLKGLKLYRKSVKAQAVLSHYQPQHVRAPIVFKWTPTQRLSKMARPLSARWADVLTSISTTSLAGGRLLGSQGRNLARIVLELRKRCYLKVTDTGRPIQAREQIVLQVDGANNCFATQCGMSAATFYRALQHPLAHLFIRTQKVQRQEEGSEARRNVSTLFTVSLYEPDMPADLETEFYAEPVETDGVFFVLDSKTQSERTKERPLNIQLQEEPVENPNGKTGGLSSSPVQHWQDSARLGTERSKAGDLGHTDEGLEGCLDRLRVANPGLWELATQIAVQHDTERHAVAAVGYYKALIHLGIKPVRRSIQLIQRWQDQGQNISNPAALLMSQLNREARKVTGFNIRDLGTEKIGGIYE